MVQTSVGIDVEYWRTTVPVVSYDLVRTIRATPAHGVSRQCCATPVLRVVQYLVAGFAMLDWEEENVSSLSHPLLGLSVWERM
jgi:hypothetical protein